VSRNQVILEGRLIERDDLRHTPAGIPALNFRIAHASEQTEAGMPRNVTLEIAGVALGEMAQKLSAADREAEYRFEGFLALRNRLSRQPVMHVTRFEIARK
jgi:primosomal replication protein N